jgi:hypothetical protein
VRLFHGLQASLSALCAPLEHAPVNKRPKSDLHRRVDQYFSVPMAPGPYADNSRCLARNHWCYIRCALVDTFDYLPEDIEMPKSGYSIPLIGKSE